MPETLKCPVCQNTGFRIEWKYGGPKEVKYPGDKKYTGMCANCDRKVLLGVG